MIQCKHMETNPPPGAGRKGEVKKRDQVYSPQNKHWTKRRADKKFMDQMACKATKFKGVRRIKK